jgi:NADH:ubiquinone oxidoreductase subunit 4 (subunit M)
MHGALSIHPWLGAALPVAIALNAYHVFRLFASLFLGKESGSLGSVQDALPRERWALSACLVLLVWLGVAPAHAVYLREPATRAILGHAPSGSLYIP